jgi:hypothetical protein
MFAGIRDRNLWLQQYLNGLPLQRRRAIRMALDRRLQQIAQFPYSGVWSGTRYPVLVALSEVHRVVQVGSLLFFYYLQEETQTIIAAHVQTTAMDIPMPDVFTR